MAIYKDGTIYRTLDEQVTHLTEVHREQLDINKNVQKTLQDLSVSANYGGYNYVRFSFQKDLSRNYYKLKTGFSVSENVGKVGDFVEITSLNKEDIPAYGYIKEDRTIEMTDKSNGDFITRYSSLTIIVTRTGVSYQKANLTNNDYEAFEGTSLSDYDANKVQKQLFTVMNDLSFNSSVQYVSFDLNGDGIYNFVLTNILSLGKDGISTISASGNEADEIIKSLLVGNSCIRTDTYDIVKKKSDGSTEIIGNVKGEQGERGYQGERGEQGIQGVQGVQGIKGDKGDKGDSGTSPIRIFSGILNNAEELPDFSSATEGDAYRIINTTGTLVTYDLYFKAHNGTDWDIQPNWGGIKGEQGERGEQGIQGVQGIQGEKGEKGNPGSSGVYNHTVTITKDNDVFMYLFFTSINNEKYTFDSFYDFMKNVKTLSHMQLYSICSNINIYRNNKRAILTDMTLDAFSDTKIMSLGVYYFDNSISPEYLNVDNKNTIFEDSVTLTI